MIVNDVQVAIGLSYLWRRSACADALSSGVARAKRKHRKIYLVADWRN